MKSAFKLASYEASVCKHPNRRRPRKHSPKPAHHRKELKP